MMRVYHYGHLNNGKPLRRTEIRVNLFGKPHGAALYASRATGPNSWAAFCRRDYRAASLDTRWRLTIGRKARILTLASEADWDALHDGRGQLSPSDWERLADLYDVIHVKDWQSVNFKYRWDCETFIIFNVDVVTKVERM